MDNLEIRKVYIFSDLDDKDIDTIKSISRVKTYNKGDIIIFDTEPYAGFFVVLSGQVKIYKISNDGKEHIVHLIPVYNTFAEAPLFETYGELLEKGMSYPANATALEDNTKVMLIQAIPFIKLCERDAKLSLKMMSGFAKRLRHLNKHIENITLKDVQKRVAHYVLSEYQSSKKYKKSPIPYIKLSISKHDLASYLGTILETLSRTFKKFSDDGIISVEGKTIYINDLDKLKEMAE